MGFSPRQHPTVLVVASFAWFLLLSLAQKLESVCQIIHPHPFLPPEVGLIDYKCFFFCRLIGWNVIPATTPNSPAVLLTDTGCDPSTQVCGRDRDLSAGWPSLAAAWASLIQEHRHPGVGPWISHAVLFSSRHLSLFEIKLVIYLHLKLLLNGKRRALLSWSLKLTPSTPSSFFPRFTFSVTNIPNWTILYICWLLLAFLTSLYLALLFWVS